MVAKEADAKLEGVARTLRRAIAIAAQQTYANLGKTGAIDTAKIDRIYSDCFSSILRTADAAFDEQNAVDIAQRLVKTSKSTKGIRPAMGVNPFVDIAWSLKDRVTPVVFDVGANIGQTVRRIRKFLPLSVIHSFEPVPSSFEKLCTNTQGFTNLTVNHAAVGAKPGSIEIIENTSSVMSSILPLGPAGWGVEKSRHKVTVQSVDSYSSFHQIEFIDMLKIDTQGYEMEVLLGASEMMQRGQIGLVYLEVIISDLYKDMAPFDEVLKFLREKQFRLMTMYDVQYRDGMAGWVDALFIHNSKVSTPTIIS
jgi:FkbM family methyltransferase